MVGALRVSNYLERIGDLAKNIAKRVEVIDAVRVFTAMAPEFGSELNSDGSLHSGRQRSRPGNQFIHGRRTAFDRHAASFRAKRLQKSSMPKSTA